MSQIQLLAHNSDQYIDADRYPNLSSDRVFRCAVERFDTQMLLDPFEKQLHLPAGAIKHRDRDCWLAHVVGQEDQTLSAFWIDIDNAPQDLGVMVARIDTGQYDGLIAANPALLVYGGGIPSSELEVLLCPCYEKRTRAVNFVEPGEIHISPVHDVEGTRFECQLVENVHIVNLACGYDYQNREIALQSQQCMHFYCCFGFSEFGPWEKRKTQVYGARIQSVGRVLQFDAEGLSAVKLYCLGNHNMRKVAEDPPIAFLVGIGQCAFANAAANSGMVESCPHCPEANLDVPEAFAIGQLRECHDLKLCVATQCSDVLVAVVALDALVQFVSRNEIHDLRKNRTPLLHVASPMYDKWELACDKAA